MDTADLIKELQTSNLKEISFQRIVFILQRLIKLFPVTEITVKENSYIERGRINPADKLFTSEKEISIREDFYNVHKYGRANAPLRTPFYGSMISDEIPQPRMTILTELCEDFREHKDFQITYTVGQWKVKKEFKAYSFLYSDKFKASKRIAEIIAEWTEKIDKSELPDKALDRLIGQFISDEFAKKKIDHHEQYKISAAVSEILFHNSGIPAIIYPSVRADYLGTNIAIIGDHIEELLELERVALCRAYSIDKVGELDMLAIAEDLGRFKTNFVWKTVKSMKEELK